MATSAPSYAQNQTISFDIPAQDLGTALRVFAHNAHRQVTFDSAAAAGKRSAALRGKFTAEQAIDALLDGSGLVAQRSRSGLFIVRPVADTVGNGGATEAEGASEIVVTAQRRAENVQKVPVSLTVTSGAQLAARQIFDPAQLQLIAPSLQVKSFNAALGASNFSIRGVGTLSFSNTIEASTTSVIDGVVMGNPALGFMNFVDIAQIEVLNGPQGMLFGKNASAGLINITTQRPKLGRFEGSALGEISQMDVPGRGLLYRMQGMLNAPLGETAALRIAGSQTHTDPVIRNVIAVPGSKFSQDQTSMRAKLLWEPSADLSILIGGDYAHSSGTGPSTASDLKMGTNDIYAAENAALGIVAGPDNHYSSYGAATRSKFDVGGVQATIDYRFGDGHTLTSITAWRQFKADNLFDNDKHRANIFDGNRQGADVRQTTQELRLASPTGRLIDYQVGLYYFNADTDATFLLNRAGGRTDTPPAGKAGWMGAHIVGDLSSRSYAAFGQATLNLSRRARLTFGGRYTYDKLRLDTVTDATDFVTALDYVGRRVQRESEKNFSWRVGGQYDLSDNAMAYVSAARGYKGPGFTPSADPAIPAVLPEIPTSYEAGIKSAWFDRRLIFNLSAYTSRFRNFQAQGFDTNRQLYLLLNAGALKSRGFEATVSARPADGLSLDLGAAYVDAFFSDFRFDRCYPGQPGCRTNGTVDSTGNRLPNVPKWTISLTGRYERPVSDRIALFTQAALYSRSASNFSSTADPNTRLAGYQQLDASIGLKAIDEKYKLTLFCRNCFDKKTPTFINYDSGSPGHYYQMFGLNSVRTIGLSLEGRF